MASDPVRLSALGHGGVDLPALADRRTGCRDRSNAAWREAVAHLVKGHEMSQRRACSTTGRIVRRFTIEAAGQLTRSGASGCGPWPPSDDGSAIAGCMVCCDKRGMGSTARRSSALRGTEQADGRGLPRSAMIKLAKPLGDDRGRRLAVDRSDRGSYCGSTSGSVGAAVAKA